MLCGNAIDYALRTEVYLPLVGEPSRLTNAVDPGCARYEAALAAPAVVTPLPAAPGADSTWQLSSDHHPSAPRPPSSLVLNVDLAPRNLAADSALKLSSLAAYPPPLSAHRPPKIVEVECQKLVD